MASSFFTGDPVYEGWAVIPTLVFPAIVPIIFFVIWLDVLMSSVYMSDTSGDERNKFKFIIKMDLLLVLGLVSFWANYFYSIANPG